ncbi:hypothetical protein SLS62_007258 [Diatrype stigma]|uniref:Uncharacterized protein n=1 Tax=Diatrype stigma TaxID=117547 RepID=A0AAN9YQZ5_9PEZI
MALSMARGALFLHLILALALIPSCKAEEPWTPDDYNWTMFEVAPKDQWNGLYINLTENPLPADSALVRMGNPGVLDGHDVLFLAFAAGLAWQALQVAVDLGGAITSVQGCVTSDGSPWSVAGCVFGLAGTLLSIGTGFQAASSAGWFARAQNKWVDSSDGSN